MYTITVYAKPLGGIAGRVRVHPDVLQTIDKVFRSAKGGAINDFVVTHIGDVVVSLVVSSAAPEATSAARDVVDKAYAAGQVVSCERKLFKNPEGESTFSIVFEERESESFVLFLAGAKSAEFWEAILEADDGASAACALAFAPHIMLHRTEGDFLSTQELLERFASDKLSRLGVAPVSLCDSAVVRTKVHPVVALGFSLGNGKLLGPLDLFDTPLFEAARVKASEGE